MSNSVEMKVDTIGFDKWMRDTGSLVKAELRRGLLDVARDAALLARDRIPHNMKKTAIKWAWAPLGAAVIATGGPAAYDGGQVHSTFKHPVFASPNIPRKQWEWVSQPTDPFIERTVHEVAEESDERLAKELQPIFDR